MAELTRRQQEARRARADKAARDIFDGLDARERGELGDALVLGDFDWRDYVDDPVPGLGSALWRLVRTWEAA